MFFVAGGVYIVKEENYKKETVEKNGGGLQMNKVRLTMEFDSAEGFSKHYLDNILCSAMLEEGFTGVRIIGPYVDENGSKLTEDFFVVEQNIDAVAIDILRDCGVPDKKADQIVKDEQLVISLFERWMDHVVNDSENANRDGRSYFKNLLQEELRGIG